MNLSPSALRTRPRRRRGHRLFGRDKQLVLRAVKVHIIQRAGDILSRDVLDVRLERREDNVCIEVSIADIKFLG